MEGRSSKLTREIPVSEFFPVGTKKVMYEYQHNRRVYQFPSRNDRSAFLSDFTVKGPFCFKHSDRTQQTNLRRHPFETLTSSLFFIYLQNLAVLKSCSPDVSANLVCVHATE